MRTHHMRDGESAAVVALAEELARVHDSVEEEAFVRESRLLAAELPRTLRAAVQDYRDSESSAALVITGLPVDDEAIGPTPLRRGAVSGGPLRQDLAFFLISALLGDAVGWATQQDGRLLHDIYPVEEHTHGQIGWGSAETLSWHTEDAFHPLRADYLGLMCLRNPDAAETTLADIADIAIDDALRAVLTQERFTIAPDDAHRVPPATGHGDDTRSAALLRRARERVEAALASPEPVAVLFGDPADPYLRVDPYYMSEQPGAEEHRALELLGEAVDKALTGVVLAPGDICFIDNYRAVHGRKPFRARFDGTDRWLRRLNIARDLRPSRAARADALARVIH